MKILTIGGGIGGLATTLALQRAGLDAHVYEAAAEIAPIGKGIWVPTNAMLMLERLGLDDAVTRSGVPLERIEIKDERAGTLLRLDLRQVQAAHRHTTVAIHRAALHRILLEHLRPGTLHLGMRCTGFTQTTGGVTVRFHDGTQVEGDVLVGADGIRSVVRQTMFPDAPLRYSGQTCYRGIAAMELPPSLARTCWEVWGGESRFGFSAIGTRQVYWFAPVTAPAGGTDPAGTLARRLAERYANFPDPIPTIVARTPGDEIIRTDLHDLSPLGQWSRGRVMLLGDAAHAMTPNLGQGGAQAIEDALLLAEKLSSGGSVEQAFRDYERVRRRRVRRVIDTAWRFGQVAHVRGRWAQALRNVAMRGVPDWMNRRQVDWLYVPSR